MTQQGRAAARGANWRLRAADAASVTFATRSAPPGSPAVAGPILGSPLAAWAALYMNVLAFLGGSALLPIPTFIGSGFAQAMLPLALFLALLANPGVVIRPNVVLVLMSTMAIAALMASMHNEFVYASLYRSLRLTLFVAVLWLLTPWWGRSDLPLLRAHMFCLRVILGSVILAAPLAWGAAHAQDGRLQGVLWPIPPPQVAHYAAVLLGCTAVMWFGGWVRRRTMMITLVACGYALIDSQTRTAIAGLTVGLLLAGASLFLGTARVRRTAAAVAALSAFVGAAFAPIIVAFLTRGQTSQDATELTGRTKVWDSVFAADRSWLERVFGSGLSNKSFNGLPIDSNWVATYLDQGLFGAGLIVMFLVTIVLTVVTRPPGPRRAVGLFLVSYCVVASFTETGLGDASPYLLDIVVAASVLAVSAQSGTPWQGSGARGEFDRFRYRRPARQLSSQMIRSTTN